MSKILKTNAARLLDKAGIKYELIPYAVDENDLAACHIAEQLSEPLAQVFKTLVLAGDRTGHFVCVVPGDSEVDLKAAAKVSGNKKCDLIPMKELLPVTGYIRGGYEKTFPYIFPFYGPGLSVYLYQCRNPRTAVQGGSQGYNCLYRSRMRRSDQTLKW